MPVTGEAICSTAGAIAPAVNMLDKALYQYLHLGRVLCSTEIPYSPESSVVVVICQMFPLDSFGRGNSQELSSRGISRNLCGNLSKEHGVEMIFCIP